MVAIRKFSYLLIVSLVEDHPPWEYWVAPKEEPKTALPERLSSCPPPPPWTILIKTWQRIDFVKFYWPAHIHLGASQVGHQQSPVGRVSKIIQKMNPTILPGVINIHLRAPTSITKSERSSLTLIPPCAIIILAQRYRDLLLCIIRFNRSVGWARFGTSKIKNYFFVL